MKQQIRLTESDLHRIVKEVVNKVLKEKISKDDITAEPYDGAKRFVPMSDKGEFARRARQQLAYFKNTGKTDKEETLKNNIRNRRQQNGWT